MVQRDRALPAIGMSSESDLSSRAFVLRSMEQYIAHVSQPSSMKFSHA